MDEVDVEEAQAGRNWKDTDGQACRQVKKRRKFTSKSEQDGGWQNPNGELQVLFLGRGITWRQLIKLRETAIQPEIGKVNKQNESYHGYVVVGICAVDRAHAANRKVEKSEARHEPEAFIFAINIARRGNCTMIATTACRHGSDGVRSREARKLCWLPLMTVWLWLNWFLSIYKRIQSNILEIHQQLPGKKCTIKWAWWMLSDQLNSSSANFTGNFVVTNSWGPRKRK
jgi:hypothetical protein